MNLGASRAQAPSSLSASSSASFTIATRLVPWRRLPSAGRVTGGDEEPPLSPGTSPQPPGLAALGARRDAGVGGRWSAVQPASAAPVAFAGGLAGAVSGPAVVNMHSSVNGGVVGAHGRGQNRQHGRARKPVTPCVSGSAGSWRVPPSANNRPVVAARTSPSAVLSEPAGQEMEPVAVAPGRLKAAAVWHALRVRWGQPWCGAFLVGAQSRVRALPTIYSLGKEEYTVAGAAARPGSRVLGSVSEILRWSGFLNACPSPSGACCAQLPWS